MKNKTSTKKKSKTLIYSLIAALVICLLSFLPYIHDIEFFRGKKGFSGFSSLRVGIWVTSLFLFGVGGWVVAFINSKNKEYRFAILAPIFMGAFQLFIYVLDSRNSQINTFSIKALLNLSFIVILTVLYFRLKLKNK